MKAIYYSVFIFMLSIVVISCQKNSNHKSKGIHQDRLLKVIDSLEKNQVQLLKYLLKDGKADTIFIKNVDWNKELFLFTNTLLSEKELKNYTIKKTSHSNYTTTEYIAKDSSEIQKVLLKNYPSGMNYNINYQLKNRLATINYQLSIFENKGYLIESVQKIPYSYQTYFRIEGLFK